jgi:hypothetical protein
MFVMLVEATTDDSEKETDQKVCSGKFQFRLSVDCYGFTK